MASPATSPHDGAAAILAACRHVQAEADALKQQIADFADLEDRIRQNIAKAPTVVTLNVGGTTFQAFKDTFLRVEGSYFHALLGSGAWNPDAPGNAYFLDLDPDIFRHVFKFLRTGTLRLDGLLSHERCQLKAMMEYLKLDETNKALTVVQWDPAMCAREMVLSNDFRTVERLQSNGDGSCTGAMAKLPLEGSLRVRIDSIQTFACIGVRPKAGFDGSNLHSSNHWRSLWSDGRLIKKLSILVHGLPHLKAGDVVTMTLTRSTVEFKINDGPAYPIELDDASEELFPAVYMAGKGTKMTMLEATEA